MRLRNNSGSGIVWRVLFGFHFFGRHDAAWSDDWFYIYETATGYGRDIATNTDACGVAVHCYKKRGIRSVIRASRARKNFLSYLRKWLGDMIRLTLLRIDNKRYSFAYRLAWDPFGEAVIVFHAFRRRFLLSANNLPCVDVCDGKKESRTDFDIGMHNENSLPNVKVHTPLPATASEETGVKP